MNRMFRVFAMAVSLFVASVLPASALDLAWDDTNAPGVVTGFNLYFFQTNDPAALWNVGVTDGSTTQVNINDDNFQPGESYTFYVTAYNTRGESVPSEELVYTVPMYTPPVDNLPVIKWPAPSAPANPRRI